MQAVILENPNTMNVRDDYKDPLPSENELIIEVLATAICGSDIRRMISGEAHTYPMVLGHEVVGKVVSVGSKAQKKWLDKRVVVVPLLPCMKCSQCESGLYSSCSNYSFIGSSRNGGFSEKLSVPETNVIEVPTDVSFDKQSLVEPATIALHALTRGNFKSGQSIGILGCGSIGLLVLIWAKSKGASTIYAVDIDDEKLEFARNVGADRTVNSLNEEAFNSSASSNIEISNCVDLSFETAGQVQSLINALTITKPGGTIVCLGNLPSKASVPSSVIETLMRKEISIRGSWMSYSKPFPGNEWVETINSLRDDLNNVDLLISDRIPFSKVPDTLAEIKNGKKNYRKIVIYPDSNFK